MSKPESAWKRFNETRPQPRSRRTLVKCPHCRSWIVDEQVYPDSPKVSYFRCLDCDSCWSVRYA